MSRVDQYDLTVSLDSVDLGTWDKLDGGDIDSSELKYKPGAMAPEITLGGSVTIDTLTVQRLFRLDRDLPLLPTLKSRVGKGVISIAKQSLDVDGNPYGNPIVYTGTYKKLTLPKPDSEGTAAALIALDVTPIGTVAGETR